MEHRGHLKVRQMFEGNSNGQLASTETSLAEKSKVGKLGDPVEVGSNTLTSKGARAGGSGTAATDHSKSRASKLPRRTLKQPGPGTSV